MVELQRLFQKTPKKLVTLNQMINFVSLLVYLRHVENGNDTEETDKLNDQIEIMQRVVLGGGSSDVGQQGKHHVEHQKPERHQRHEVVELVRSVHDQTQQHGQKVQSE